MSQWEEITIGDLGRVVTGNTPPKKDPDNYNGVYPFIKPTDMTIGLRHVEEWEENYSEKAYQKYKNSYIPPGSTGVVTIGTVGDKIFQSDRWCFTNQSVNVVIPNRAKHDPDFIYYLLKLNLPKVENANPGTASGRHHVSKSNFCAIKVKVPDLLSQRKIASILSAYDDLIENNLKRIKLLEEKAQLTYEEWFIRMKYPSHENDVVDSETELPLGWNKKTLNDLGKIITGKTPSKNDQSNFNGEIPFIKTPDLADFPYVFESVETLSQKGASLQKNKFVPKESLLVSCIGSAGQYSLTSKTSQFNQQINGIVFHKRVFTYFTYCFSKTLKDKLDAIGSNGATMTNVNKRKFSQIEVVMPTERILAKFHKIVAPGFSVILNLLNTNNDLIEARNLLLPRLMSGMIDIDEIKYNYPKETLA